MYTLVEFLASVKATEYVIAIAFIIVFVGYWLLFSATSKADPIGHDQRPK